jgi:bile acid:Na+ symporter, BASS family
LIVKAAELISVAISTSLALISFGAGLAARPFTMRMLLQRPSLLLRSLFAMNVVMPLIAVMMAKTFELERAVLIGLVALSVAPVPPLLPRKELAAGGASFYVIGLTAIAALVSIVVVPGSIELIGALFGRRVSISSAVVAKAVLMSVLLPLVAGFIVRWFSPSLASNILRPVSILGTGMLGLAFLPILLHLAPAMAGLVGAFSFVAIVAFSLTGLFVGHALGGPHEEDRTVLALSTSSRHPGVALAIVHLNAPDSPGAVAAILLALIVGAFVSVPYVRWRKRRDHTTLQLHRSR